MSFSVERVGSFWLIAFIDTPVLIYALYGHPRHFKFKQKYQQYGSCFQTIFPFLMDYGFICKIAWNVLVLQRGRNRETKDKNELSGTVLTTNYLPVVKTDFYPLIAEEEIHLNISWDVN